MGTWSYLSRDNLKLHIGDTATTDDAIYRRVLESTTELIDNFTNRTFRTYTGTRIYTPKYSDRLDIDDLLAVTTLKTDEDDAYTYGTTWATTDYALYPFNASVDRRPYTRILTKPNGTQSFRLADQSVQVIGSWGFWQSLETSASTLNEVLDATETGVDVTAGTDFDVLDTIIIDSEQMYITAIATNTLTVVRGVNGTTAATHSSGATIQRYIYPGPVVEACGMQAARVFNRRHMPFGVLGTPDVGYVRLKQELDPDVQLMLTDYRKLRKGVV